MNAILEAAEIIAAARRGRTPLGPLPAGAAPHSEAEGYQIQDALRTQYLASYTPINKEADGKFRKTNIDCGK